MALVHSRSCLHSSQTFARRVSWAPWKHPWPQTSRSFRKGWPWFFWGGVLVKVQTTGHHGWKIYVYFVKIFFPRTFSQWYRGKEWLDGSHLLMCYLHAGSLVSHGDLKRQISHICCFRMSELIARHPKQSFNFPVQNNYHQLPLIRLPNHFQDVVLQPFQGTRAGYHGSRSSTSAVGDWGRNFPCDTKRKSKMANPSWSIGDFPSMYFHVGFSIAMFD